jgi:hypothetical protein
MAPCPVCQEADCPPPVASTFGDTEFTCPRCGRFWLRGVMKDHISTAYWTRHRRSILSHRLRRRQRDGDYIPELVIVLSEIPNWGLDEALPSPAKQLDRLIEWIGDNQPSPFESLEVSAPAACAWIGAVVTPDNKFEAVYWLLKQEDANGTVMYQGKGILSFETDTDHGLYCQLTMAGWQRYEAIKRATVNSRTAFMAMKFNDPELDNIVVPHFKIAVAAADFKLRPLTDDQPAGLIDDQMRVALRTARFVIADLTHGSNGAYWEAGFAEGLGRPVIYTCRKDVWDARGNHDPNRINVHFDTRNLFTIDWDPANITDAGKRLTAAIRNTLPGEAKMADL